MKNSFLLLSVLLLVSASAHANDIKDGQWSMTMTTKMEGASDEMKEAMKEMENMSDEDKAMMKQMMGGMNIQMGAEAAGMTTTVTHCVTGQDPVPDMPSEEKCEKTFDVKGNTVNFHVVCKDSDSTGVITYQGDAMKGTINSTQTEDGKTTQMTIDLAGKYEGPCK